MNKKELKNKKFKNKNSTKNCSNLISNHQPLISDHKGITLIALVITIIVMLILVGVTVTVALNGGLFNQAKDASRKTQNEINKENGLSTGRVQIGDKWYNSIEDYAKSGNWTLSEDGKTVISDGVTLNIGDYVNYTYDPAEAYSLTTAITGYSNRTINQTEDLKWRILGVDTNGYLTLISDKPASNIEIGLDQAIGYNNGVYILNDICAKQYSNKELGITARSLTIEDVEGGFSDKAKTQRNNYTNSVVQYDKSKTYSGSSVQYPALYAEENGSGIGLSEPYYTEAQTTDDAKTTTTLACKQTYYNFDKTPADYCKDSDKFYKMIFSTGTNYWLASRYVNCLSDYASFGLRLVRSTDLRGGGMFYSNGGSTSRKSQLPSSSRNFGF